MQYTAMGAFAGLCFSIRRVGLGGPSLIRGFKQTDFFLHAHTFSMVSESRRNPYVAPSVSSTSLSFKIHAEPMLKPCAEGKIMANST